MKKTVLSIKNLNYSYGEGRDILNDVNLDIKQGDLVAIIGPNGAGKSTLVKLVLGLISKQKGSIKINGKLSYIPQKYNSDVNFPAKVSEILDLECCACDLRGDVLKSLGIFKFQDKQFKDLSGGQQQRVLIALSILSNPDILILDEPTVGVDSSTQNEFYDILKRLNAERNLTILFVTHDTGMVSTYFNKVLCIHDKKVYVNDAKKLDKVLKDAYGNKFRAMVHNHSHGGEK